MRAIGDLYQITDREKAIAEIYDRVAFACRYGHQDINVVFEMEVLELGRFNAALARMIEAENRRPS
jgi:hypothetical protein